MGDLVRTLTEEGIRSFREYLASLRAGATGKPPRDLLADPGPSVKFSVNIEIEQQEFATGQHAAKYLYEAFKLVTYSKLDQNEGLWTWLSLYYFDHLCPADQSGRRSPGQDYRHILDKDFRRYYRHLLAGPCNIFRIHSESAPLLLCHPVSKPSKFFEEFSARQGFITNKGIIGAANILYYDPNAARPKRGASSIRKKAGTLMRFIDVVQQLDLTYDLYSMSGEQVLDLLPQEFDEWRKG